MGNTRVKVNRYFCGVGLLIFKLKKLFVRSAALFDRFILDAIPVG